MMEFSPYHALILLCLAGCVPLLYALGSMFTPDLSTAGRRIAARLAMGALVFVVANALAHAGMRTMLVPFVILLPLLFVYRSRNGWADLAQVSVKEWVAALLLVVGYGWMEMHRSDLRIGQELIVGNWDVSFYSGTAHDMYASGAESLRTCYDFKEKRIFYHFGDLWFCGFFSYHIGVLPFYAFQIIYRVVFVSLLALLLYNWASPQVRSKPLAGMVVLGGLMFAGLRLFYIESEHVSLLQTFLVAHPVIGHGPYLMPAVIVALFSLIAVDGSVVLGMMGLMLMPLFNPALALVPPAGAGLVMGLSVLSRWVRPLKEWMPFELHETVMLFAVSLSTYGYAMLDGRTEPLPPNLLTMDYLYLVVHTLLRLLISTVYVIPFVVGTVLLGRYGAYRGLSLLHVGLYMGMMLSFSVAFPHIRGNSHQILHLYVVAVVVPLGTLGLLDWVKKETSPWRWTGVALLAACVYSAGVQLVNTNGYERHYRYKPWDDKGYIGQQEATEIIRKYAKEGTVSFGYGVCNPARHDFHMVRYSEFTYLRGIIPGSEFFRLTPLPQDITESVDNMNWYNRSYLARAVQAAGSDGIAVLEANELVRPDHLLLIYGEPAYCVPDGLAAIYTEFDTIGRFIVVSRKEI